MITHLLIQVVAHDQLRIRMIMYAHTNPSRAHARLDRFERGVRRRLFGATGERRSSLIQVMVAIVQARDAMIKAVQSAS